MKRTRPVVYFLFFFLLASQALSQVAPRYLAAATIYLSVDDWGSMWLNGHPIVDQVPYTTQDTGPRKITCLPGSLCLFQKENILAIEVDNAVKNPPPSEDHAGIAYVLILRFTDGTETVLSSGEKDQNLSYYIPDRYAGEPMGWHYYNFNDTGWDPALGNGGAVPYSAVLVNPEDKIEIPAMSALSAALTAKYPGERHLFRRKFSLQIDPNPNCAPAPVITPPTATPIPRIFFPTATPTPRVLYSPLPLVRRRKAPRPTPTPVWLFVPRTTAVPFAKRAPLLAPELPVLPEAPEPRPTLPPSDSSAVSVFEDTPANIYLEYADGPGFYRLEVLSPEGKSVRELFNKKVVAQKDEWVEWDGKGDGDKALPDGVYSVVLYKEGRVLHEIPVRKKDEP